MLDSAGWEVVSIEPQSLAITAEHDAPPRQDCATRRCRSRSMRSPRPASTSSPEIRPSLWKLRLTLRPPPSRYYRGALPRSPSICGPGAGAQATGGPRRAPRRGRTSPRRLDQRRRPPRRRRSPRRLRASLPFIVLRRSPSSEDLLEHLDVEAGKALLRDCHRVLKPGGVMRLLTPASAR